MDSPARVILCMAMSLDGWVKQPHGNLPSFTSRMDREHLFEQRAKSDVILVGAETVRKEQLQPLIRSDEWRKWRLTHKGNKHPDVGIVSGSGHLPFDSPYFGKNQTFHIFSTSKKPDNLEESLVWHEQHPEIEPHSIKSILESRGYGRILLEGGPKLAHTFFEANLIDEVFLTLSTIVFGGSNSRGICYGNLLNSPIQFKIKSTRTMPKEVIIHLTRD